MIADVGRVLLLADVLAHLDRADRVELRSLVRQFAVVLQAHLDPVGRGPARRCGLRRSRAARADSVTPVALHAVVLGGVQDQRAPAAADVEQPHARLQVELAADQVELGGLRVVQRLVVVGEVRRRVRHVLVEQQLVEVVGQVVVVRDRGAVAVAGVQAPGQPRLGRRPLRRRADRAEPGRQRGGPHRSAATEPRTATASRPTDRPRPPQAVGEVAVDVEIAGHVRPRQPHLAWRPEQSAQRPPRCG